MSNMTISDIAREAGVSKATVSRVLNNSGPVNEKTREKIMAIIRENHYSPSPTARTLSGGTSSIIGFVVPEIDNPFFGEAFRGAMEVADGRDLYMIFYNTDDEAQKDRHALRHLMDLKVAGILYTPAIDYSNAEERAGLRTLLDQLNVPVVIMDRNIGLSEYDVVYFNDYQGVLEATERLIQAGHRKIGILNATLDRVLARERENGYLDALEHNNIPVRREYMFYGDYHTGTAYELSKQLLAMEDRPTAVLTCNNRTTIGFLRALYERGEQVPNDIICVGLDRIDVLERIRTPLNYIGRDARTMGREAAKLLVGRMQHPRKPRVELLLDTNVITDHINSGKA